MREALAKRILEPVLPPEVKISSGQLITQDGAFSPETDLILYAPQILPPALYDANKGYIPAECCLYAIEVKTRLNATKVREAAEKARSVAALSLMNTEHWTANTTDGAWLNLRPYGTPKPLFALFAYGSDLKGSPHAELERLRRIDLSSGQPDRPPNISVLCIRGRGYWFWDNANWRYGCATPDFDEIIGFASGVSNTMPQLLVAKGRPRLGRYLSGGVEDFQTLN